MNINRVLKLNGTLLDKSQLKKHLEKIAANHNVKNQSSKDTYPIPAMLQNFEFIKETYNLLNEHLKLGITIHPAGEWLLDNFYIIEETVKQIEKELTTKKYSEFLGLSNGDYEGFARVYVLASEIVAYTEGKIEKNDLEDYIKSYQTKRTLNMDEIWNIGLFLQIAIISNIKEICEKIYSSQIQKYKVENIVERLIENKSKQEQKFKNPKSYAKNMFKDMRYSFIEYMSYTLKRYGKKTYSYLKVLDEMVEMAGGNVLEVINKEHFDIALKKVLMGNYITSIKKIQRIDFLKIFQKLNGVEEILNLDPANCYPKMDHKSKSYYRNKIKEISHKTKISEIYIAKKILEMAEEKNKTDLRKTHIGYYLIDEGINELYEKLDYKNQKRLRNNSKVKIYVTSVLFFSSLIDMLLTLAVKTNVIWVNILTFLLLIIPSSEIVIQVMQYILSLFVKPKLIPKLDFINGIDTENETIVVIPTILNNKEKVEELMKKLEVFYIANKSENLYFALLGDCTQSKDENEDFDKQIIDEGLKLASKLNEKYNKTNEPIFHFLYRKRTWNDKEECFLGWERKRGLLNQFNEFILNSQKSSNVNWKNTFKVNTLEENNPIKDLKYVITLDADTDLCLGSAFELVGTMAHVLNKPIIDKKTNTVVYGHGIIQPRVGVDLNISYKNIFTKLFAGAGGIDSYSNAISDIYQDNFEEGIFTGKGIYDIKVFSKVMENTIPENTVLSHDLLEGNYLRCGLASDIILMDGYPTKYLSFMNRLSRWIRGDWQIISWLKNKSLNLLSKFKILDNIRRSLLEISVLVSFLYLTFINCIFNGEMKKFYGLNIQNGNNNIFIVQIILAVTIIVPFILELLNLIILKKEGEKKQKEFSPRISGVRGAMGRLVLTLGCLPYKAYISLKAITKTLYRMIISKKHMLEWVTSEEAEQIAKCDLFSYYKQMVVNVIGGIILFLIYKNAVIISLIWIFTPYIMCMISKDKIKKTNLEKLNKDEKTYVFNIAKKTWDFFSDFLNEENNYLIPDNYQEDRKNKIVFRTSSTNIGLSLLSVISAFDMNFIEFNKCIEYLENILVTIEKLDKWNGHLYNWYDTKKLVPLTPRYISTVDSGNFVGYLYVVKSFLNEQGTKNNENKQDLQSETNEKIKLLIDLTNRLIENSDFSKLYDFERQIFSIGFNIEENKLTDSYYDLLASEARQASLVAIAKKDIPSKHWNNLSRTVTVLNGYSGLVSWSGTAFEYLMPNINIPKFEGSLLDESCKFMIMSQKEYAKKLNIPWGISEAAFNLKDLHFNYQYKAFGIPWLGLKRGLADEFVVSSYGCILAINDEPQDVVKNMQLMEQYEMNGKYGFYESIDFTPERVDKGKKANVVKTYMAHHQGLILLSINNLFNNNILQKRFMQNPEMSAVSILLQERKPEKYIVTKEDKEKVRKLKYVDYESYTTNVYTKLEPKLIRGNVISNENYIACLNQKGEGFSKYKEIYINRYKQTKDYNQGIFFYIKNIRTKDIVSTAYAVNDNKQTSYEISFSPDKNETKLKSGNIKIISTMTLDSNEPVEIRRLTLENMGNNEEMIEVSSYFEPILSTSSQDYAHPTFNNLFLNFECDKDKIIVSRRVRSQNEKKVYLATSLYSSNSSSGMESNNSDLEYEIDKEKFVGRGNFGLPIMVENSLPFSSKMGYVTDPIVSMKKNVKIQPGEIINLDLVISVEESKDLAIANLEKYKSELNVKRTLDLAKARVDTESRYLRVKGKDISNYQKMLSYMIFQNPAKVVQRNQLIKANKLNNVKLKQDQLWKYGISGDMPIILVKIENVGESYVIKEVLKAYEFFKSKKIDCEIIIIDEEKHSYENYVREEIENAILNRHMGYLKNIKGGIFTLSINDLSYEDMNLLEYVSTITVNSKYGGIENNLKEIEETYLENYKDVSNEEKIDIVVDDNSEDINILDREKELKYYNEYGGFSKDGKEYLITVKKDKRLPTVWSNILANEKFGTLVTENGGGYTWYKNCRLNRLTAWENDPCADIPSEIIYLKNMENKKVWSFGLNPMPDDRNYNIVYGFGYTKYIHLSQGIEQELTVFVPRDDSVKVQLLKLKNTSSNKRKIKLYYYLKNVLGEDEIKTCGNIDLLYDQNCNVLCAKNLYNCEIENNIVFASCSEKIKSYTGDKNFFLGIGGLKNPDGISKLKLNNENSIGKDACICFEIEIEIDSFSEKEIILTLGAEQNLLNCKDLAYKYGKVENCYEELNLVRKYWENLVRKMSSKYTFRVNEYSVEWMDGISNN